MRIAVSGSIATDHLMTFPGQFADSLVATSSTRVAVLPGRRPGDPPRRGGGNIAFGLASSASARCWSARSAPTSTTTGPGSSGTASTAPACASRDARTPRASCAPPTRRGADRLLLPRRDERGARHQLAPLAGGSTTSTGVHRRQRPRGDGAAHRRVPTARHPLCRRPLPAARPPATARRSPLVDGAAYLFTNEYEWALIGRRPAGPTTRSLPGSASGSRRSARTGSRSSPQGASRRVPRRPGEVRKADPTGVGDAFRAGFLAGRGLGPGPRALRPAGRLLATYVLETVGTQEYRLERDAVCGASADAYGDAAADDLATHLPGAVPARTRGGRGSPSSRRRVRGSST